jgi:hypothetical protein
MDSMTLEGLDTMTLEELGTMTLEELGTMTLEEFDRFEGRTIIDSLTLEEMDSLTLEDIDFILRTEPGGCPELKEVPRYLYERQRELRKQRKQQRKKQRRQQRKQQLKQLMPFMPFMDWAQGGDQNHGILVLSGLGGAGKSALRSSLSDFILQERTESHQDSKDQEVRIFEIPGLLATHSIKALGDYGAKKNFIKEELAIRLGLPITRDLVCKVTVGSGQPVTTTGAVTAPFRFKGEHNIHDLTFYLLPECIHDVILGKPFLKLTETFSKLTNFYRRVKERVVKGISQFHLLYLGASSPMFEGSVNGQPQAALADSGSKVLVMDEAYARSIGVSIQTGLEYQTILTFADNSTADTCGMAYGVEWRFGRDGEFTSPYQLNFHILKNAPANVILCDTFLYDNRAFSIYNHYLTDNGNDYEDEDNEPHCFAIDIDKRKKRAKSKKFIIP